MAKVEHQQIMFHICMGCGTLHESPVCKKSCLDCAKKIQCLNKLEEKNSKFIGRCADCDTKMFAVGDRLVDALAA